MANRPCRNYDYRKPDVLMLTLKVRYPYKLCKISQTEFTLLPFGEIVREELLAIPQAYPQIKIGQYQIMPDHLHVIVHTIRELEGKTALQIMAGFKAKVLQRARELGSELKNGLFEQGINNRVILTRDHLVREVAYIRDNVRRYRLSRNGENFFRKVFPFQIQVKDDLRKVWGLGNRNLLDSPVIRSICYLQNLRNEDWEDASKDLEKELAVGTVFVSSFLSSLEKRAAELILVSGGQVIHVTHLYFGACYKPCGIFFNAFCQGNVLEVSASGEFQRYARLNCTICTRLNEIVEALASGNLKVAERG